MNSETVVPEMIVPYQWILEKVKEEPTTITSKMILFRGEKIFRVSLRNQPVSQNTSPVLHFLAVNLNKMGMKACKVFYSSSVEEKISEMNSSCVENEDQNLQLFTTHLPEMIVGKCTFTFRILIRGSCSQFSYELSDRLLKFQLWESVVKNELHYLSDIKLVTKSKVFPAHKAILAARSHVLAAGIKENAINDVILITDVDSSVVEEFLYFLYTGEPKNSFANDQLVNLAYRYGMGCLSQLCEVAQLKIDMEKIAICKIGIRPNDNTSPLLSSSVEPDKDTELYYNPTSSFFLFTLNTNSRRGIAKTKRLDIFCLNLVYHKNVKWCAVNIIPMEVKKVSTDCVMYATNENHIADFTFDDNDNNGFQCVECYHIDEKDSGTCQWILMKRKEKSKDANFTSCYYSSVPNNVDDSLITHFSYAVKVTAMVENYRYEFMEKSFTSNLLNKSTAHQEKLTDVEISIGIKVLLAHRVVLSVRSPVFKSLLDGKKKDNTIGKIKIAIHGIDFDIVRNFLDFLYTGQLKMQGDNAQLLELAEFYKVDTLIKICKSSHRVVDIDQVTFDLLT